MDLAEKRFLLNRRTFMVAAAGGALVAWELFTNRPPDPSVTPATYPLPDRPLRNPAFRNETSADGLLLCTHRPNKGALIYRLNGAGARIWNLCDGKRNMEEIAGAAAGPDVTGEETKKFVKHLVKWGLVVNGGYVRTHCEMVKV